MNRIKRYFSTVGALSTLVYFLFSFLKAQPTYTLDNNTLSNSVDTIITELTVQQFDETGQLAHYLYTPELQHIPLNNRHELKSPQIMIKQAMQPDWKIEANHAQTIHGAEQITFTGNVIVHQDVKANRLNTEELTYYSNQKLAISPTNVLFTQPGSTVQSKGMRAYLDKNYLQLLSQSHATFDHDNA